MLRKERLYNYLKNIGEERSVSSVAIYLGCSVRTIRDVGVADPRIKLTNYHIHKGRVIFVRQVGDIRISLR